MLSIYRTFMMRDLTEETEAPSPPAAATGDRRLGSGTGDLARLSWRKVRGGVLLALGWLLSPLCWWNDLFFNLPVAYGFGMLCRLICRDWLVPGTIVGYWLSNLLGLLLMQAGAVDVFQTQPQQRNLKQDLVWGVATSSLFTALLLALLHFQILELPALFAAEGTLHLSSLWAGITIGH